MDCPRRWTGVAIIIYLSFRGTTVFCQNVVLGEPSGNGVARDNRDCSKPFGFSSGTELYNSILSAAASNGVLPDLLPMLQGQPILDNFQRYNSDILTKPLSVLPMSTSGCCNTQDPIVVSGQALRPPATNQNFIVSTPVACGSSYSPNTIPAIPQTISPPVLPVANCVPQIAQPLENYPICAQNTGVVQPMPIVLQPQCQFNELNPYNVYNQIFEPTKLPDLNNQQTNLPIIPSSQILPIINTCSGPHEIPSNLGSCCYPQHTVFTNDGQQLPLNLQINVPTPSVPAPRITLVSATPTNTPVPAPCNTDISANSPQLQYPPPPPIVIGGSSKSSLKNLLPMLLVALLSDNGCNKGSGCCCCCCCNDGNSGNTIPIPYPIPIPINNPIINTCPYPYSSRNREHRDYGDDDEDWKRK